RGDELLLHALVVGIAIELTEHEDAQAITVARCEITVLQAQAAGGRLARGEPAAVEAERVLCERQGGGRRQRQDKLTQRRVAHAEAAAGEPSAVFVGQQAEAMRRIELRRQRQVHRSEMRHHGSQAPGSLKRGGEDFRGVAGGTGTLVRHHEHHAAADGAGQLSDDLLGDRVALRGRQHGEEVGLQRHAADQIGDASGRRHRDGEKDQCGARLQAHGVTTKFFIRTLRRSPLASTTSIASRCWPPPSAMPRRYCASSSVLGFSCSVQRSRSPRGSMSKLWRSSRRSPATSARTSRPISAWAAPPSLAPSALNVITAFTGVSTCQVSPSRENTRRPVLTTGLVSEATVRSCTNSARTTGYDARRAATRSARSSARAAAQMKSSAASKYFVLSTKSFIGRPSPCRAAPAARQTAAHVSLRAPRPAPNGPW